MIKLVKASLIALAVVSTASFAGNAAVEKQPMTKVKTQVNKEQIINLNTADLNQLQLLKGVGASKALAIFEYRKQNGKFKTLDDLLKVKGIGEKFLESNKGKITL